jgi:hypothetical protein
MCKHITERLLWHFSLLTYLFTAVYNLYQSDDYMILSPLRLPISPSGHELQSSSGFFIITSEFRKQPMLAKATPSAHCPCGEPHSGAFERGTVSGFPTQASPNSFQIIKPAEGAAVGALALGADPCTKGIERKSAGNGRIRLASTTSLDRFMAPYATLLRRKG